MAQGIFASESHDPETESQHWLSPADLIARLDLRDGMTLADIEADAGYFAIPISRQVEPGGRVFAVGAPLDEFRAKLRSTSPPLNIEPIEGSPARTTLPDASCDRVLLADVWHALDDPVAALREAKRILREGGQLAIIDWRPDAAAPPGPPPERRVPMHKVICTVELNSWTLDAACEIGPHGYLLVIEPSDESVQT